MKTHIDIIASSVRTAAGPDAFVLYAATAAYLLGAEQVDEFTVKNTDREEEQAFIANVDEDYHEPLLNRLSRFLSETLDDLSPHIQSENRILIAVITPPKLSARMQAYAQFNLADYLKENLSLRFEADLEVMPVSEGASRYLAALSKRLYAKQYSGIILCGVDSLINIQTLNELHQEQLLLTTNAPDGFILGEAVAGVLLRLPEKDQTRIGRIRNIQYGIETTSDEKEYPTALHTSFNNMLQEAEVLADKLNVVIYPMGSIRQGQYEWYNISSQLWPMRASEQQRVAMMLGEIDVAKAERPKEPDMLYTSASLGHVGAATLPVNLAMACARYEFEYPKVKRIVVCETSEGLHRGVVFLMP